MKRCTGIGGNDRDADRVRLVSLNQIVGGDKGFTPLLRETDDEKEMKPDAELTGLLAEMGQHRDGQALLSLSQMHDLFIAGWSHAGDAEYGPVRVEDEPGMRDAFAQGPVDAVITDHNLPRFDSFASLKVAKAFDPDIPVIVLSGEIEMELDNKKVVTIRQGDVMIQRGTYHAWRNVSDKSCRMVFVLIDAKPLGIGHALPRDAGVERAKS